MQDVAYIFAKSIKTNKLKFSKMNTPKFKKGQTIFDSNDNYVKMIVTGTNNNGTEIDGEPIYRVQMYAKNSNRFIGNTIIRESRATA